MRGLISLMFSITTSTKRSRRRGGANQRPGRLVSSVRRDDPSSHFVEAREGGEERTELVEESRVSLSDVGEVYILRGREADSGSGTGSQGERNEITGRRRESAHLLEGTGLGSELVESSLGLEVNGLVNTGGEGNAGGGNAGTGRHSG